MIEKLENCPSCGEGGKRWHYDFQRCEVCGHDGLGQKFERVISVEKTREMLRDKFGEPQDSEATSKASGKNN